MFCDIPEERTRQAEQCAQVLGDSVYADFPLYPGVEPLLKDRKQLILNRTWKPALTVTGANGFPAIADAGNVLRPQTALKLSMRLPPLVDPEVAAKVIHEALTTTPLFS